MTASARSCVASSTTGGAQPNSRPPANGSAHTQTPLAFQKRLPAALVKHAGKVVTHHHVREV